LLSNSRPIKRVTNSDGVGLTEAKSQPQPALKPEISWLMTNIMQDVLNRGTASRARAMGFTGTAAGKTGTSRDGWFAGYTPNIVCVVWVGFDDNSELGLEGAKSALPIWTSFMKAALALRPELFVENFPPAPDGIVNDEIDPTTGLIATDQCPAHRTEYFIEGTQPQQLCEAHSGEHPEQTPMPGFAWPEGQTEIEDRARKVLRDAEKGIDDAAREMKKQIKKATGKP
jgi:penicillin-binding protein 1B